MYVYRCEDTLEGILTGIYRVYEDHRAEEDVLLALDDEPRLFAEVVTVEADAVKSRKVADTLVRRFGMEDYERVCLALTSPDAEKAQAVYRTVHWGLKCGRKGHLFDNQADIQVCKAYKLSRNAGREYGHLQGFLRFEELESGAMYARVRPANHLLPFLMPHFADRFPEENFLIHDVDRNVIGVHGAQDTWFLVSGEEIAGEKLQLSDTEERYQALFRHFCNCIGIEERRNPTLQRNLLPLHFRKYMTEF